MKIRAMQLKDMEEVVGMMRVFYDSPGGDPCSTG